MRRIAVLIFAATLVFLTACGGGKPTAGTWQAKSNLGDFSFEVADNQNEILTLTFKFKCTTGPVTKTTESTIEFTQPLEISGGSFEFGYTDLSVAGTFSSADAASGTISFESCSGEWQASP